MTEHLDERAIGRRGIRPLPTASALDLLDACLRAGHANPIAARLHQPTIRRQAETEIWPLLRTLVRGASARTAARTSSLARRIASLTGTERHEAVLDLVRREVATVLG